MFCVFPPPRASRIYAPLLCPWVTSSSPRYVCFPREPRVGGSLIQIFFPLSISVRVPYAWISPCTYCHNSPSPFFRLVLLSRPTRARAFLCSLRPQPGISFSGSITFPLFSPEICPFLSPTLVTRASRLDYVLPVFSVLLLCFSTTHLPSHGPQLGAASPFDFAHRVLSSPFFLVAHAVGKLFLRAAIFVLSMLLPRVLRLAFFDRNPQWTASFPFDFKKWIFSN